MLHWVPSLKGAQSYALDSHGQLNRTGMDSIHEQVASRNMSSQSASYINTPISTANGYTLNYGIANSMIHLTVTEDKPNCENLSHLLIYAPYVCGIGAMKPKFEYPREMSSSVRVSLQEAAGAAEGEQEEGCFDIIRIVLLISSPYRCVTLLVRVQEKSCPLIVDIASEVMCSIHNEYRLDDMLRESSRNGGYISMRFLREKSQRNKELSLSFLLHDSDATSRSPLSEFILSLSKRKASLQACSAYEKLVGRSENAAKKLKKWLNLWRSSDTESEHSVTKSGSKVVTMCPIVDESLKQSYIVALTDRPELILMNIPENEEAKVHGNFPLTEAPELNAVTCIHVGRDLFGICDLQKLHLFRIVEREENNELVTRVELSGVIILPVASTRLVGARALWEEDHSRMGLLFQVDCFSEIDILSPKRVLYDGRASLLEPESSDSSYAETEIRRYVVVETVSGNETWRCGIVVNSDHDQTNSWDLYPLQIGFWANGISVMLVSRANDLHLLRRQTGEISSLEFLSLVIPSVEFHLLPLESDDRQRTCPRAFAPGSNCLLHTDIVPELCLDAEVARTPHCLVTVPVAKFDNELELPELTKYGLHTLIHILSNTIMHEQGLSNFLYHASGKGLSKVLARLAYCTLHEVRKHIFMFDSVNFREAIGQWRSFLCASSEDPKIPLQNSPGHECAQALVLDRISNCKAHAILFALALQFLPLLDASLQDLHDVHLDFSLHYLKWHLGVESVLLLSPELIQQQHNASYPTPITHNLLARWFEGAVNVGSYPEVMAKDLLEYSSPSILQHWLYVWKNDRPELLHFQGVLSSGNASISHLSAAYFVKIALLLEEIRGSEQQWECLSLYLDADSMARARGCLDDGACIVTHIGGNPKETKAFNVATATYLQFCLKFIFKCDANGNCLTTLPLSDVHVMMEMLTAKIEKASFVPFPELVHAAFSSYCVRLIQEHEFRRAHALIVTSSVFFCIETAGQLLTYEEKSALTTHSRKELARIFVETFLEECASLEDMRGFIFHDFFSPNKLELTHKNSENTTAHFYSIASEAMYTFYIKLTPSHSGKYLPVITLLHDVLVHHTHAGLAGRVLRDAARRLCEVGDFDSAMDCLLTAHDTLQRAAQAISRTEGSHESVFRLTPLGHKSCHEIQREFFLIECVRCLMDDFPNNGETDSDCHSDVDFSKIHDLLPWLNEANTASTTVKQVAVKLLRGGEFVRSTELYGLYGLPLSEIVLRATALCASQSHGPGGFEPLVDLFLHLHQSSLHYKEVSGLYDAALQYMISLRRDRTLPSDLTFNYLKLDLPGFLSTFVVIGQKHLSNKESTFNPSLFEQLANHYRTVYLNESVACDPRCAKIFVNAVLASEVLHSSHLASTEGIITEETSSVIQKLTSIYV